MRKRLNTVYTRSVKSVGLANATRLKRLRQFSVAAFLLSLAACSSSDTPDQKGQVGFVQGFLGGVAVDEPRASLIGRDVLSAGGNAVDAATAIYFAMSATFPAAASLGGGGVCVVYDPVKSEIKALDFTSPRPKQAPVGIDRPNGVPMNVRGFFALHTRYGDLRWEQLITPAETIARFGAPMSRALSAQLQPVAKALLEDSGASSVFLRKDGSVAREGDIVTQIELASLLTAIRVQGPGEFYSGKLARQVVEGVKQAGGWLSLEDLRDAQPQWRDTLKIKVGNNELHVAPPPAAGGVTALTALNILAEQGDFEAATENLRSHLLAESMMVAFGDRARWMGQDGGERPGQTPALTGLSGEVSLARHRLPSELKNPPVATPENPSAATFAVADRNGLSVSCALSMNNLFGTGRMAKNTGMFLSAAPGINGRSSSALAPMMVVNPFVNEVYFVGAASGGVAAPSALVNVVARTEFAKQTLEKAVAAKRVHHGGEPDTLYYEPGFEDKTLEDLKSMGHRLAETPSIGWVNGFSCPQGLPHHVDTCEAVSDPRGFGLAVMAD